MQHVIRVQASRAWQDWLLICSGGVARIAFTVGPRGLLAERYDNQRIAR